MEQHPIPQNVTTFQFRLIGDMTVKQFAYLAIGAVSAYVAYKLPLPFFFTYPLAGLCAFFGIGFAFIPIEERPMDVWVLSFIKNIYSPTQFLWQKDTPTPQSAPPGPVDPRFVPPITPIKNPKPSLWQSFVDFINPQPKLDKPHPAPQPPPATISTPAAPAPITPPPTAFAPQPTPSTPLPVTPPPAPATPAADDQNILQLKRQLEEAMDQKRAMEATIAALKAQNQPHPAAPPPAAIKQEPGRTTAVGAVQPPPAPPGGPTVKVINPNAAVKAGLPRLTTFPNIPTGIVKDVDGNFLPGILVTIKDRDGVPLRALKTNKLGQFAASTQLPTGVYFVEIEDPRMRFVFDRAQITINGAIMPPLEIIAKSQKQLDREKLSKEIFGNP